LGGPGERVLQFRPPKEIEAPMAQVEVRHLTQGGRPCQAFQHRDVVLYARNAQAAQEQTADAGQSRDLTKVFQERRGEVVIPGRVVVVVRVPSLELRAPVRQVELGRLRSSERLLQALYPGHR